MKENHDNPKSWSELPQDLVVLVFKCLGFADFKRAKSVCSSWHSASRQSVPKNQVPWLIFFPKDNKDTSLKLFNPEEKNKVYKTQAFGVEFANSVCRATYESWFLMQDRRCNFYIMNLFTREKINLPPMESQLGMKKAKRTLDGCFAISDHNLRWTLEVMNIRSPVFWIDKKTKEYIVLCGLDQWSVVYSKKGNNFWNQIPELSDCYCMIYKDHKLYCISERNRFTILDFSGQIPQQTFQCVMFPSSFVFSFARYQLSDPLIVSSPRFVVTIRGDVFKVERLLRTKSRVISFRIFKIYSSSGFLEKYDLVDSLGDETILLDLGITVLANKVEGLKRNSIYFRGCFYWHREELCIFNLETQKMERLHIFDFQRSLSNFGERWFVPSFTHT